MTNEPEIKRWSAKRKADLINRIYRGQTTIPEAARQYDLTQAEIERWLEDAESGLENALKANPKTVADQYKKQIQDPQSAYGEAMLENRFQ